MAAYTTVPAIAKTRPTPFTVSISDDRLQHFKQLLKLSSVAPETYENQQDDRRYGLPRTWLSEAKTQWEESFDWRAHEKHINSFPHYTLPVKDPTDGRIFTIHFVALFSTSPSATPLAFYHGWPGSFLEFLPMLSLLQQKYPDPSTIPYHVIVPSLPGYAFSSNSPLDKDWKTEDSARVLNQLMVELGLGSKKNGGVGGYIAQGGDIGSHISRSQAAQFEDCIGMHLNFSIMQKPETVADDAIDALEAEQLVRAQEFMATGSAYAMEHGTRPATIGLVLSSSPLALLAWIGEKFLAWSDQDPSVDTILESVTLYWLTDTFPTAIYPYRQAYGASGRGLSHTAAHMHVSKPFGYSYFPWELAPMPKAWVATTGNLVWYRQHSEGGHFAALERPELLLGDVEDFIGQIRQDAAGKL